MPHIFISYRREDTGYVANILADKIRAAFGADSVFMDVDTIPLGVDFRDHINQAVAQCNVLLAIIGDHWFVQSDNASQRRIDEAGDFVRLELEAALNRNIPVIPVLASKAKMPSPEDLPDALKPLAFRHATELRSGRDLNHHLDELIQGVRFHLKPKLEKPEEGEKPEDAISQEWTATYEDNKIRVTNWWTWSGKGEAKLYVNSDCVDTTTGFTLKGVVQDRAGADHVVEVLFGGMLTVKAKIMVDGVKIGGDLL